MIFDRTRKNTRNKIKLITHNQNNDCKQFSDGFMRRMTTDLVLTPYRPPPDELKMLNNKFNSLNTKNSITDEERYNFIDNFDRRRAKYLESVKNGTNQY
jgi:hypothetical protein